MSFAGQSLISKGEVRVHGSTKKNKLGTVGRTPDGRTFVYCKAGEDLLTGRPVVHTPTTGLRNSSNMWTTDSPTPGISSLNFNHASSCTDALSVDELEDGFVWCEAFHTATATTGGGQWAKITGNTAKTGGTATDGCTIYLDTEETFDININPTTSSDTGKLAVQKSLYMDVTEYDGVASETNIVIGVPSVDVNSGDYFWAQTWGPCCLTHGGSVDLGNRVWASTDTATDSSVGYVGAYSTTATDTSQLGMILQKQELGYAISQCSGTGGEYDLFMLTLMP